MSAKPLRTRSKSASAERCLRPLGATIDMATPDPKTSNGFSVQGIFAWGFTKRQPGGRGGYRVLSLSGNCWVFHYFVGIHVLYIPGQGLMILNLTDEHQH